MNKNLYFHRTNYILIFIITLNIFNCGLIVDPIDKVRLENNSSYIEVQEAVKIIFSNLAMVTQGCPTFINSGMNDGTNWTLMLASTPQCGNTDNEDASDDGTFTPCEKKMFMKKSSLNFCLASLLVLKSSCDDEKLFYTSISNLSSSEKTAAIYNYHSTVQNSHFASFFVCSKTIRSTWSLPMFFL